MRIREPAGNQPLAHRPRQLLVLEEASERSSASPLRFIVVERAFTTEWAN
jgi:hypothetical protein